MSAANKNVIWFEDLSRGDVALVGGKNSSLGEMVQQLGSKGIDVPPGFATTSDAFRAFIKANNLNQVIADAMEMLDAGKRTLAETGKAVRAAIAEGDWPDDIREAILSAYRELAERTGNTERRRALVGHRRRPARREFRRSAGDLSQRPRRNAACWKPAGSATPRCSPTGRSPTATSRASITSVALSIGVQLMVRSDIGGSGVMFSIDTEPVSRQGGADQRRLGPGRKRGAGRGHARRIQVYKPFLDNRSLKPIIEKTSAPKRSR
jgi:pyruvate,water dikinase